jgi:putative ABC transport system substrate-binding protein
MKNKRNSRFFIMGLCFLAIAFVLYLVLFKVAKEPMAVAIFTTLSHPALIEVRAGFIEGMKEHAPDFALADFNAEGNVQQANTIAQHLVIKNNIKGIFTIGTLATQSMIKSERKKPIVFAAVSDPIALSVETFSNLCGLSDAIDADYQISTILDLLPHVKTISLLYSPHEANSSGAVSKLEVAARKRDIGIKLFGIYDPQQISTASLKACQNADAILIPLDNQIAAAMPLVIKALKEQKCPVIISDQSLLHHGAAIAFGLDYQKIGWAASKLMADILAHKLSPREIGFINPSELGVYVNRDVLKEKGISLNPEHKTKLRDF